jgi:hypothetical protein
VQAASPARRAVRLYESLAFERVLSSFSVDLEFTRIRR